MGKKTIITQILLYVCLNLYIIANDYPHYLIITPNISSTIVLLGGIYTVADQNLKLLRLFVVGLVAQLLLDIVLVTMLLMTNLDAYVGSKIGADSIDYGRVIFYFRSLFYTVTVFQVLLVLFTCYKAFSAKKRLNFGHIIMILLLFITVVLTTAVVFVSVGSEFFVKFAQQLVVSFGNERQVLKVGAIIIWVLIMFFKAILTMALIMSVQEFKTTMPTSDESESGNKPQENAAKKWFKEIKTRIENRRNNKR